VKILDKYIAKQVITSILLVSLVLLGVDLFFTLVNELRFVARTDYTLSNAFTYLALTAPTHLYTVFPWAALVGALISLGTLAGHSELVVMRVAGISVLRITGSVLKAALLLMVFIVFIGEGIAPETDQIAENKRSWALSGGQSIQTSLGLWVRQGRDFIHVKSVQPNGELLGVTRYLFSNNRKLQEVSMALKAIPEGNTWHLFDIVGTRFEPHKTETFKTESLSVEHLLDPEILQTATVKHPERLSLSMLLRIIEQREKNELNTRNYTVAFWSKIFHPLVILLMVFLAVPFVFGPLRSVSMGFRIVSGLIVAFLFHTLNSLFVPLAVVYQLPPVLAVLTPIFLFGGLGIWMLKRVNPKVLFK